MLTIILFLFGILIFQTIISVSEYRKVNVDHQIILTMYLEILSNTQKALIHLYQFKSGIKTNFDSMINYVIQNDEIMEEIPKSKKSRAKKLWRWLTTPTDVSWDELK